VLRRDIDIEFEKAAQPMGYFGLLWDFLALLSWLSVLNQESAGTILVFLLTHNINNIMISKEYLIEIYEDTDEQCRASTNMTFV
jgi:hypothetical protein